MACAAMMRSPSFSRSGKSRTMMNSPFPVVPIHQMLALCEYMNWNLGDSWGNAACIATCAKQSTDRNILNAVILSSMLDNNDILKRSKPTDAQTIYRKQRARRPKASFWLRNRGDARCFSRAGPTLARPTDMQLAAEWRCPGRARWPVSLADSH